MVQLAIRRFGSTAAVRSAKTHFCVISVLALFIVCAESRTVNKNVITGAVIRAKPG